ncbi:transcription antitermination factor NusB [Cytophaga hutchinsonii]|uniref:Antitermination factor n=1 Tax=Cytophaga hutchinsonii (strain ATCC 33406 / DSM 1761 / CIP 103989 / NBRC 15051 / NCIMB 9469 / D465) TaxID=269798 RepID=A0A6N4STJ2_CYTH3|nr:transcription antitermination factor NusB [Cytophaga hutchinsonii]ABG59702.1 antitermination factor [Cytophaga hutchinsonii ATCC 33406]SFX65682.1 NusB antitermination factor [Cytophaga hutchinsonii ATCC 33406]
MLNRRILRIKVMQSLYALYQTKVSNYHLGMDEITELFAPDLMSPDVQDVPALELKKKTAHASYEAFFEKHDTGYTEAAPDIRKAVTEAINQYHNAHTRDVNHFKNMLLEDVARVEMMYKLVLFSATRLMAIAEADAKEGIHTVVKSEVPEYFYKLKNNPVLLAIEKNKSLRLFVEKNKLNPPVDLLKTVYKKKIKQDPLYIEYQKFPESTFEKDKEIVQHLVKTYLFKNEQLDAYWEDLDYNWSENDEAIRSLTLKAVKGIVETTDEMYELPSLSPNWEDDQEFMLELYKESTAFDDAAEKLITDKVQNWDIERLAFTDRIILKMALTEMVKFPNIPVKVTINEYIELSKSYSTPKSKQFVNGLLDTISIDLQKSGLIQKSGRGLMDNK